MSLTFRERLASDPYFAIRIQETERLKLCPYSDRLLEREDPTSVDYDSKIKMMNTEEFHKHVRQCQEEMLLSDKQQRQKREQGKNSKVANPFTAQYSIS